MTKLYIVENESLFKNITVVSNYFGDTNSYVFFREEDVIGENKVYGEMEYTHDDETTEWMNFAPVDDFIFLTPDEFEQINVQEFENYFNENGLTFDSMQGNGDYLFFETFDADGKYRAVKYENGEFSEVM